MQNGHLTNTITNLCCLHWRHKNGSLISEPFVFLYSILFANICQTAFVAIWFCSGGTHFTSMVHKSVAEITSFFRRNQFPKCHFYLLWFLDSVHKTYSIHNTDTMCICYDCWFSKYVSHNQIRTLSSNAWQDRKSVV